MIGLRGASDGPQIPQNTDPALTESKMKLIKIPLYQKKPVTLDWPDLPGAEPSDLEGANVGLHLEGFTDIDLDCPEAIALAPQYLPETATFGRSHRSHWLYEGESPYKKFLDPIDKACLLEIRSGYGKQTIIPPSIHESKEPVVWHDAREFAPAPSYETIAKLATMAWCAKHPGLSLPPKVLSWATQETATPSLGSTPRTAVFYRGEDEELISRIAAHYPAKGARHDYRMACAGAMQRAGIDQASAERMLVTASERAGANVHDAELTVRDTYGNEGPTTGAKTLVDLDAAPVADRINALVTPEIKTLTWLDQLEAAAIGGSLAPFDNAEVIAGLARLQLTKDSRLPQIWARLKDGGYSHLKELKDTVELRARELRDQVPEGPQSPVTHPLAKGLLLPPGYQVEEGILKFGETTIMHGELVLLAKCPSSEGTQVRFSWRSPSNPHWRNSIAPYRSLVDARGVLCLAEHGVNISSLEAPSLVAFVRDFVAQNEPLLDRPVATQTGWHESGAFIWGRTILDGPPELQVEYPADNQIGAHFVEALRSGGDRAKSYAALRETVETLPTAALCVAAALAAPWVSKLKLPAIGVHLAGMGGRGKTRTIKIVASVWGYSGGAAVNAATGIVTGANTTQRALEVAASVRNDLPFLISDIRPFPGLTETLHAVLNGDPRARATQRGGATLGLPYRAGAVISEGELNVLALTTRQGFHRRMLELEPDDTKKLWELGSECSEHFGWLGPESLKAIPSPGRIAELREECLTWLGADTSGIAAILLESAERCAGLIGASPDTWKTQILAALGADRSARDVFGSSQVLRAREDLAEILTDLAPRIAPAQAQTNSFSGSFSWVGYHTETNTIVIRAKILQAELVKRGHDAIGDAIHALKNMGVIRSDQRLRISSLRQHCYEIVKETDLDD